MLTEEQLNNLKPGDPIIIHGAFYRMASGGEIVGYTDTVDGRGKIIADYRHIHRSCVSLPPERPKYDPCRKFKKGDIVVPKLVNGRSFSAQLDPLTGEKCVVEYDEEAYNLVDICHDNRHYAIDPAYIELVDLVDEPEPYSVKSHEEGECGCFEVMLSEQCVSIYPYGTRETRYYKKAEQAKSAAEAECKRLNAEYRKIKNYNQN